MKRRWKQACALFAALSLSALICAPAAAVFDEGVPQPTDSCNYENSVLFTTTGQEGRKLLPSDFPEVNMKKLYRYANTDYAGNAEASYMAIVDLKADETIDDVIQKLEEHPLIAQWKVSRNYFIAHTPSLQVEPKQISLAVGEQSSLIVNEFDLGYVSGFSIDSCSVKFNPKPDGTPVTEADLGLAQGQRIHYYDNDETYIMLNRPSFEDYCIMIDRLWDSPLVAQVRYLIMPTGMRIMFDLSGYDTQLLRIDAEPEPDHYFAHIPLRFTALAPGKTTINLCNTETGEVMDTCEVTITGDPAPSSEKQSNESSSETPSIAPGPAKSDVPGPAQSSASVAGPLQNTSPNNDNPYTGAADLMVPIALMLIFPAGATLLIYVRGKARHGKR